MPSLKDLSDVSSGARGLIFRLSLFLLTYFVFARSERSGSIKQCVNITLLFFRVCSLRQTVSTL